MRTNIVLDDELVEEAERLTGIRTRRELVREGLKALIRARRHRNLLDLEGGIRFADDYDPRALRERSS